MDLRTDFINAIHSMNKLEITFFSKEDKGNLIRLCAPLDIGPMRRNNQIINNGIEMFHVWDYSSDKKPHPLALHSIKIKSYRVLKDKFDPGDFDFSVFKYSFFIPRDWGKDTVSI
jgi:hypothetical protein